MLGNFRAGPARVRGERALEPVNGHLRSLGELWQ